MFNNNFINNIVRSMMALCVVANGWSSVEDGLESPMSDIEMNVAQKRVNVHDEDSISKMSKNGSPISVNTPPPYNNGNDSSQTLTPVQQPNEENSNTIQPLESPSLSDTSSLEDSEDESEYAWLDDTGIKIYVKGVPEDLRANVVTQIKKYDSKGFAKQMGSALLSGLTENAIHEILKENLEEILNMSYEDFAQKLAYPLIRSHNLWKNLDNANTLKTLSKLIRETALSLGVIGETFKDDSLKILQLLNQYAIR